MKVLEMFFFGSRAKVTLGAFSFQFETLSYTNPREVILRLFGKKLCSN